MNIFFKDVTCGSHAACLANRPNESNLDCHRRIKLKLLLMGTRRKKNSLPKLFTSWRTDGRVCRCSFNPKREASSLLDGSQLQRTVRSCDSFSFLAFLEEDERKKIRRRTVKKNFTTSRPISINLDFKRQK